MKNWKWLRGLACAALFAVAAMQPARADYVGELETTKYFDDATIALIQSRIAAGQGLLAGDVVSYFIQFTPTNNGGMVGGGGFVTDYVPAGMQVVDAQFVRLNGDGTYTQIAPPSPAAVLPYYVPFYSDTGIFYSTDPRTAPTPANAPITSANGFALAAGTGCKGISLPSTTHNAWDSAMQTKYVAAARNAAGTCAAPPVGTYNALTAIDGLSPVAGPDAYLTKDSTGAVGPWQRIAYPGSYKGTNTGVAAYGLTNACIGGVPTSAGWSLSPANPLPVNTTAVRFAAGKVTVGELFSVHISFKLTANMPLAGIVNNTEVFGGDASLDPGSAAGKDNHWKYHCPAVAVSNSNLLMVKKLAGACVGVGCVPTPVTAGVVPSAANLKLRYTVQYINTGSAAQTNVVLKDTFPTGAAYVAGSYVQLSGAAIGAPTASATVPVVLTFPTIASLAPGTGGVVQYDVNYAAAPANNAALINTAALTSTQVPGGVTSKSIATASTKANLWISKATTTPSVTPGGTASYTITIPNNGGGNATAVVVNEFLPTAGVSTLAADRFSYVPGSVAASVVTSAGVATAVAPAVAITPPAAATAREQVTFTLPAATAIPMGGKLVLSFNAAVGANVPASAAPYTNNANVSYAGGATASSLSETIGTAPVTVTAPMTLTLAVDCVYAGATCVPYTNGTIAPGSKIRYRASYKNISAATLNNVVVTDTLPANTTFVAGTGIRDGAAVTPTVAGQALTFPNTTLAPNQTGYVTFDVQLGAAITSGTDIVNTAKITAATFAAGVTASVTTSVRDQANLVITKSVAPASIQPGGSVTYTVTVTNTGNAPASGIVLYDLLPFTGTVADATARFSYGAAGTFTLTNTSGTSTLTNVAPALSVPPTFTGYTVQTNRQEVKWTFAAAQLLGKGDSFTLTYTAAAGVNMPGSTTPYTSDLQAQYVSATNTMYASAASVAPVTIGGLDHIQIVHDGMAGVCTADVVTVQACANASCSTLYTGSVSVTLAPATGWGANPVVIGASGTATATYTHGNPGTVRYAVSAQSVASLNPFVCDNNTNAVAPNNTTECDGQFSNFEFVVSSTDPLGLVAVAGRPHRMKLEVFRRQGTQCGIAANYQGNKTLFAAYADASGITAPSAPLPPQISVSANCAGAVPAGGLPTAMPAASNVTLNFTNGVVDPFYLCSSDIGKLSLEFRDNAPTVLTATTPTLLVRPFTLYTAVAGNPGANTPAGAVLTTAGSNFAASVAGILWQAADDVNNVGVPDAGANLADNGVTPHYAWLTQLSADTAVGTYTGTTVVQPAGTTALTQAGFANGASSTTLQYDEVGSFTLNAAASNYLNAGINLSGSAGVVGRFKPHYFDTASTGTLGCASPTPFASCPAGNMVYSGQPYAGATVTAKNAKGAVTVNYQGAYAKTVTLSAVDASGGAALATGTLAANNGTTPPSVAPALFSNGVALLTSTAATTPKFTLASPTPLDVYLRANDGETVSGGAGSVEGGLKVVAGRIKLANAYGAETLALPMMATTQFWSGAAWVTSLTDSITSFNSGSNLVVSNLQGALTGVSALNPGVVNASAGVMTFRLAKPGVTGSADININSPAYLTSVPGRATFGVYKGNNELIYLREAY